jgi:hypothetical protein
MFEGDSTKRRLAVLERVGIASPCSAPWEEMVGDDYVRFCEKCEKNVYNLSILSRAEAEALLEEREGKTCVRFYRRSDGTMLTMDCPVGVRRKRVTRVAATAGALLAALVTACKATHTQGTDDPPIPLPSTPPATSAAVSAIPSPPVPPVAKPK